MPSLWFFVPSAAIALLLAFLPDAVAGQLIVNSTSDAQITGTLRWALTLANAAPNSNITFDPIVFSSAQTITLASAPVSLTANMTIVGPGSSLLSISGAGSYQVFSIASGTISILALTIENGKDSSSSAGGGVSQHGGTLYISGCVVTGCAGGFVIAGGGGGGMWVASSASLTVDACTFSLNTDPGGGCAIYSQGTTTVTASTFVNNTGSAGSGGAVYQDTTGSLSVYGCTFFGNGPASAISTGGITSVMQSTFTANVGNSGWAAGLYIFGGTLTIGNSIVQGNTGSGADVILNGGSIADKGHNLIGTVSGTTFSASGDLVGVNAQLLGLASNGGPTQTCALNASSPAVDAGNDSLAVGAYDQRGQPWMRIWGAHVDIGAFELQPTPTTAPPTTAPPTTAPPTTAPPTTAPPTTAPPTTAPPTTAPPATTPTPTTAAPATTTPSPSTIAPTTVPPATSPVTTPPGPTFQCSAPLPGAVCVGCDCHYDTVNGSATINDTITLSAGQTLTVNGSLILETTAILYVVTAPPTGGKRSPSPSAPIIITGTVALNGTLSLTLTAGPANASAIPVISAENITGAFHSIVVQQPNSCLNTSGSPDSSSSDGSFDVLLSVQGDPGCHDGGGLPNAAIAGIVLGCVIAAALAVGVTIYLVQRRRKQRNESITLGSWRQESIRRNMV